MKKGFRVDDTLAEQGFLSQEMVNVVSHIHSKYKPWLNLIQRINKFAVQAQYIISIQRDDTQELLAAVLYMRTLSNIQAGVLLIERGMDVQARIMLRAATESLFSFAAISRSKEFAEVFVVADECERKRMFNKIKQYHNHAPLKNFDIDAVDAALLEIEAVIKEKDAKKISVEELSKKADMHDLYLTSYSFFSLAVHSRARNLEHHHVITKEGVMESLQNEPIVDKLELLWLVATELLLSTIKTVGGVFLIAGVNEFIEEHQRKKDELATISYM